MKEKTKNRIACVVGCCSIISLIAFIVFAIRLIACSNNLVAGWDNVTGIVISGCCFWILGKYMERFSGQLDNPS